MYKSFCDNFYVTTQNAGLEIINLVFVLFCLIINMINIFFGRKIVETFIFPGFLLLLEIRRSRYFKYSFLKQLNGSKQMAIHVKTFILSNHKSAEHLVWLEFYGRKRLHDLPANTRTHTRSVH